MKTVKKVVTVSIEGPYSTEGVEFPSHITGRMNDIGVAYIFKLKNQFERSLIGLGYPSVRKDGEIMVGMALMNGDMEPGAVSMTEPEALCCWRHEEGDVRRAIAEKFKADYKAGAFKPKEGKDAEAATTGEELSGDE